MPSKTHTPECDSCNVVVVNGVPTHEEGCPNYRKTWRYGRYGDDEDAEPTDESKQAICQALADILLGETVVTNDRVLNYVLTHAGEIIGRRDMTPLAKFEILYAYLLKSRREVLGATDV
jgi:hypothetical protein